MLFKFKYKKYHKYCGSLNGAPNRIRTCDLSLRRGLLYPAELSKHLLSYYNIIKQEDKPLALFHIIFSEFISSDTCSN